MLIISLNVTGTPSQMESGACASKRAVDAAAAENGLTREEEEEVLQALLRQHEGTNLPSAGGRIVYCAEHGVYHA